MDDEPFWSGWRLSFAYSIAAAGAFALIGLRPIWSAAPAYADAAYRAGCLAGAVGAAWWMYRHPATPKPWLSNWHADRVGKAIEVVAVAVLVLVLVAIVAFLAVWWLA